MWSMTRTCTGPLVCTSSSPSYCNAVSSGGASEPCCEDAPRRLILCGYTIRVVNNKVFDWHLRRLQLQSQLLLNSGKDRRQG